MRSHVEPIASPNRRITPCTICFGGAVFRPEDTNFEPAVDEGFCVRDESSANWVIRKIAECRSYAERVTVWAAAEIRRAEKEEEFFLFRFGGQLERWASEEIRKLKGRRKSLNLPAGAVGFRRAIEVDCHG